jgi:hypothetical protein
VGDTIVGYQSADELAPPSPCRLHDLHRIALRQGYPRARFPRHADFGIAEGDPRLRHLEQNHKVVESILVYVFDPRERILRRPGDWASTIVDRKNKLRFRQCPIRRLPLS